MKTVGWNTSLGSEMSDDKLRFECPGCSKTLGVATTHVGKTVACPHCKTRIKVSDPLAIAGGSSASEKSASIDPSPQPDNPFPDPPISAQQHAGSNAFEGPTSAAGSPTPLSPAKPSSSGRWIAGLSVAVMLALAFSLLWVVITVVTGMELGILAWGLGGAIGLVAGMIGRNPAKWYCVATAAIAMSSVLLAKLIMAAGLMLVGASMTMLEEFANYSPERQIQMHALADQLLVEGTVDAAQQEYAQKYVDTYFSGQPELMYEDVEDATYEISEAFESVLSDRLDPMSEIQKDQLVASARQRHPEWIEDNNHYYAMIDQLTADQGDLDPDLAAHAKFQLAQLNQDYDQTYSDGISPKERKRRSADLRQLAAKQLVPLDDQTRDQAVRDAMTRQTHWNPFPDASTAMMEKMVRGDEFQGDVGKYAAAQVSQDLEGDYSDYDDETPFEEIEQQRAAVQAAVNAKVAMLDPDARQALIADTQSRYPDWYGQNMSPEQRKEKVEAALDELGTDGTFLGSLKAVFGLLDFLWLFLGASTAFATAKKYGEA